MKVIVNADDYGASERHSRLILQLLKKGKLTSTTFLVNLPYSGVAAAMLREQHPELLGKVGLHFNLTEGAPLNPRLKATPFVNHAGQLQDFRGRVPVFRQVQHMGKLRRELDLQISEFHDLLGTYPTHIDSHGHTHCTWVILLALLLSRQAGKVRAVRLTRQYDHEPAQMAGIKNKIRRVAKHLLNFAFRLRFRTVQYFTDIRNMDGTWLTKEHLQSMQQKFSSVEIMCHPYYFDEAEYDFLDRTPNMLEQVPGLEFIGYSEIK